MTVPTNFMPRCFKSLETKSEFQPRSTAARYLLYKKQRKLLLWKFPLLFFFMPHIGDRILVFQKVDFLERSCVNEKSLEQALIFLLNPPITNIERE